MKKINNYIQEDVCSDEIIALLSSIGADIHLLVHRNGAVSHNVAMQWIWLNFGILLLPDYFYYDGMYFGYKFVSSNGKYGEIWKPKDTEEPSGCDNLKDATEFALLTTLKDLLP